MTFTAEIAVQPITLTSESSTDPRHRATERIMAFSLRRCPEDKGLDGTEVGGIIGLRLVASGICAPRHRK